MSRVFSVLALMILTLSGCATVYEQQVWQYPNRSLMESVSRSAAALSDSEPDYRTPIRMAVVPEAERLTRQEGVQELATNLEQKPDEVSVEEVLPPALMPQRIAAVETQTPSTTVRVYYGTNRPMRGEPAGNRYGTCDVSIPARHQFGELERPSLWRLEFRESAAKHVLLQQVTPLAGDVCLTQLRSDLQQGGDSSLFVFVHGYNVSFAEAAMRTAQMAFDLRFAGVPIFYSWPSAGQVTGYSHDLQQADLASGPLAEFLTRIAQESGARQIHLVAHSMGNRALAGALTRIGHSRSTARFNQVVFAAPDLDAGQFATQIAPYIQPVIERVTIYSSGSDLALWASQLWNRTMRLGRPGYYLNVVGSLEWVDVIDTTAIGFDWFELGHSAYGSELLVDLQRVLAGQPPGSPHGQPDSQVWSVARPAGPPSGVQRRPPTVYRVRPSRWPTAPVDRW